ncbi:helix-turn-helix domain-containing protein [Xylophilus rhododendri]
MTQSELAARSGIGVTTLSNLEAGRNTAFEGLVRVAMALGRRDELEALFKPRLDSLDDIRRYESGVKRKRIKKKSGDA